MKIVPYKKIFPRLFLKQRQALIDIFKSSNIPFINIEHFGSTAVPGLAGKGVIDIIITFSGSNQMRKAALVLQANGFFFDNKQHGERLFLSSREKNSRAGDWHLHLTLSKSPNYQSVLAFRDYLRTHPELAQQYSELKQTIISNVSDRASYTKKKTGFIEEITRQAILQTRRVEIQDK